MKSRRLKFRITSNEGDIIKKLIYQKGLTQTEVASRLGFNPDKNKASALFCNRLAGKSPFTIDVSKKLYNLLDKDPSVEFLLNIEGRDDQIMRKERSWSDLYDYSVNELKSLYLCSNYKTRVEIISELENIIGKYKNK